MGNWWNPWWYGAYRWLADPAEPALDPGFWNLRGAVDKVLHPTVLGQASWLVGGWPQQLVPQGSYEALHQVADTLPSTASPGTPAASGAVGTVRYDVEEVARILEALDQDLGAFWRAQGRIVRTPYDGRQAPVTPISIMVDMDVETHADEAPELAGASQPVWTTIPDGWTAADIAAYVRDRINPTSTTSTATPGSSDGSNSSEGSSLVTPQEQAQQKFRSYHQARDSAASARLSKPRELTKSEKLQAYLEGVLAQDDGEFRSQFKELAGNLGRAAWTPPKEMGAYTRGFLTGFFIHGAWGNIQGLWGMVKWGAWLTWNYNSLMLSYRMMSGDDFAKERQFAAKAIDVASIMYKITGVVGTKLGEGIMAHYEALKSGSAEDLRQLGGTHQQFAAAMLGLAVKLSEEVVDPGKRGEIVGAISWEIAQTAAEILLTAGVSKVATGSAKFTHIADKLADFGKYSDKFGDVAKRIARWFDEGGELRRLLTKLDEAVAGVRRASRAGLSSLFGHNEYKVVDRALAEKVKSGLFDFYRKNGGYGIRYVDDLMLHGRNGALDTVTGEIWISKGLRDRYPHLVQGTIMEELHHFHQLKQRGWFGRELTSAEKKLLEHEVVRRLLRSGLEILE